ncbi:hypothetical protein EBB79_06795 [Parasedimentitalea marina]|uniref:Pilus assembly protein PilP n=1 Tax=Parasedimentitalea marina TaxID=2483033 RepID=A0A3T0N0T0_9RHOB|nr:hypothetical protein [Parasedimentitalea marina]AZV77628.1 hypothetical protein EBB79_06795 [Parasedimentitalea marina]
MTNTTVAKLATQDNALDQRSLALMGLFGPAEDLTALVRLPSGRVRRVSRGARLSSGRVVGIDAKGVLFEKNGTTRRIVMPGG